MSSKCTCSSRATEAPNLSIVFFEGTEEDLNRTSNDGEAAELLWAHLVPPTGSMEPRPAISAHEIEIARAYLDGNLDAQQQCAERQLPKMYSINSPQGMLTIKQEVDEKQSSTTVSVKTVFNAADCAQPTDFQNRNSCQ